MTRIRLAFWHGTHQPGDEIDVTDDELATLQRDGRVAAVLKPLPAPPPAPAEERAATKSR
jgi:hypothetical protein